MSIRQQQEDLRELFKMQDTLNHLRSHKAMVQRARKEYEDSEDFARNPIDYNDMHRGFYFWVQRNYGVKVYIDKDIITDVYEVIDKEKYTMFVLKFAA